jgi:hypothetical protein
VSHLHTPLSPSLPRPALLTLHVYRSLSIYNVAYSHPFPLTCLSIFYRATWKDCGFRCVHLFLIVSSAPPCPFGSPCINPVPFRFTLPIVNPYSLTSTPVLSFKLFHSPSQLGSRRPRPPVQLLAGGPSRARFCHIENTFDTHSILDRRL